MDTQIPPLQEGFITWGQPLHKAGRVENVGVVKMRVTGGNTFRKIHGDFLGEIHNFVCGDGLVHRNRLEGGGMQGFFLFLLLHFLLYLALQVTLPFAVHLGLIAVDTEIFLYVFLI